MSPELKAFKAHFESKTNIRVMDTKEDKQYFHWKRLIFPQLDAEQMMWIAEYILMNFSTPGRYSHRLPKLHAHGGCIALTIDKEQIHEFIISKA